MCAASVGTPQVSGFSLTPVIMPNRTDTLSRVTPCTVNFDPRSEKLVLSRSGTKKQAAVNTLFQALRFIGKDQDMPEQGQWPFKIVQTEDK